MPDYTILISIIALRVLMGLRFVFPGWGLIMAGPDTAKEYAKYIQGPFASFIQKLTEYKAIEYLNKWGMFISGLMLVFGFLTRLASYGGILLMTVYWLTRWPFKEGIVTEHIVYIAVLLFLVFTHAGIIFGFDTLLLQFQPILKLFASSWAVQLIF